MGALREYLHGALAQRAYAAAAGAMWLPGTPLLSTAAEQTAAIRAAGLLEPGDAPSKSGASIESLDALVDEHLAALGSATAAEALGDAETKAAHWKRAAAHATAALAALLRAAKDMDRAAAPLMMRACANAIHAGRNSGDEGAVQEAARAASRAFSLAATDRSSGAESSRRWATYGLAALLLRTHFALGTVRLCEPIVRAVRAAGDESAAFAASRMPVDSPEAAVGPGMPPIEAVPRSQAVAYEYYCAALAAHGSRLAAAEAHLLRALWLMRGYAPSVSAGQQSAITPQHRRLLVLLVVVRMARGVLPAPGALSAWGLETQLGGLAQAVRLGDPRLFDSAIEAQRPFLAGRGVLLAVQLHLRPQLVLSLVRRTYAAALAAGAAAEGRLPVGVLVSAGRALRLDGLDADAAECLVAGLVHARMLRAYVSHGKQVVVLSRKSPFVRRPLGAS